jgi:hypothetical protein
MWQKQHNVANKQQSECTKWYQTKQPLHIHPTQTHLFTQNIPHQHESTPILIISLNRRGHAINRQSDWQVSPLGHTSQNQVGKGTDARVSRDAHISGDFANQSVKICKLVQQPYKKEGCKFALTHS